MTVGPALYDLFLNDFLHFILLKTNHNFGDDNTFAYF